MISSSYFSSTTSFMLFTTGVATFIVIVIMSTTMSTNVNAWVSSSSFSSPSSSREKMLRMVVETPPAGSVVSVTMIPSGLQNRWSLHSLRQRQQQHRRRPRVVVVKRDGQKNTQRRQSNRLGKCQLPWQGGGHQRMFVYETHWDWQMRYFQEHLTNMRVKDSQDHELLHLVSKDGNDRIYTVSLESEEYRDIRMTYLHCDNGATQIFRCTCYPRANNNNNNNNVSNVDKGLREENDPLPVLGMGFMQFAGGRRNIAIMDYQPLRHDDQSSSLRHADSLYQGQLNKIRSQYPNFQQSMSDKHFDADEKQLYWTDVPLIAKWNDDGKEEWSQLESSHQRVLSSHVQLTKSMVGHRMSNDDDDDDGAAVKELHAEYDTFLSAREPAGHLLTRAFGPELARRMVHQVLFPLSR